jgi:hypothetical protein
MATACAPMLRTALADADLHRCAALGAALRALRLRWADQRRMLLGLRRAAASACLGPATLASNAFVLSAAGHRRPAWTTEECFQRAKSDLGLQDV